MFRARVKLIGVLACSLLWCAAVAAGFHRLWTYQSTPAASTTTSSIAWPADAPVLAPTGYTLALFLHPQCPCSQATLSSLDHLIAHAPGNLRVYVFAALPSAAPPDWANAPLLRRAAAIPGVQLLPDPDAKLARLCGARASGHTLLFDSTRHLRFSGGITPGRGHEGENAGLDALHSLLLTGFSEVQETPVFGCSLSTSPPSSDPLKDAP